MSEIHRYLCPRLLAPALANQTFVERRGQLAQEDPYVGWRRLSWRAPEQSPYAVYLAKVFDSPLLTVRQGHKPLLGDTRVRVPFPVPDLGQGDNAPRALVNVEIGANGAVLVPADPWISDSIFDGQATTTR